MKAYRRADGGVQLFRPEQNALRMQRGAERLLMAAPSVQQYIEAVKQVVAANKSWVCTVKFLHHVLGFLFLFIPHLLLQVPPYGKGALYIRPLLFGSGSVMGIAPAPQCTFLIYTNPICNVYKVSHHVCVVIYVTFSFVFTLYIYVCVVIYILSQGRTSPLNLLIDDRIPRAFPGGTGGVKNIGNYSPVRSNIL